MDQIGLDLFQLVDNVLYKAGCGIPAHVSLHMLQGVGGKDKW